MSIQPSPFTTPDAADGAGTTAPPGPRSATCGAAPSPSTPITAAGSPAATDTEGAPPAWDAEAGAVCHRSTSQESSITESLAGLPLGWVWTAQPNAPAYTPRSTCPQTVNATWPFLDDTRSVLSP